MVRRRTNVDPYMEATLREAATLQSGGHYKAAINAYVEYLQQLLLTSTAIYYDLRGGMPPRELQSRVFKLKQKKRFTLGAVISGVPKKLRMGRFDEACRYIQDVRNDIQAHPYYVLNLTRTILKRYEMADVNAKRRYIRSIYKHVKDDCHIPEVVYFLTRGHPLTVHRGSDLRMIECERLILQRVTENVERDVKDIYIVLEIGLSSHARKSHSLYKWLYGDRYSKRTGGRRP